MCWFITKYFYNCFPTPVFLRTKEEVRLRYFVVSGLQRRHTMNETVRDVTACTPDSEVVRFHRIRFFGHLARKLKHKITTASQLTRGDRLDVQEQLGSERLMKTSSHRTLKFTLPGGRPRIETFGDKSSVRQRFDKSSARRRRRIDCKPNSGCRYVVTKLQFINVQNVSLYTC